MLLHSLVHLIYSLLHALDFRHQIAGNKSSEAIEGIFNDYRKVVPFISDDVYMHPLIQKSIEFIR